MFDALTGSVIRSAILRAFGAPGPSGVGVGVVFVLHFMLLLLICVMLWHFLLAVYVPLICHLAFLLPSSHVDLLLDKCPGVQPTGVCEVAH